MLVTGACGSVSKVNDTDIDSGLIDGGLAVADAAADAPVDALEARHIVFVSSTTFTGDQNGIAGFNAQCQSLADEAGLSGTFAALLHTRSDPLDDEDIDIQGPVFNTNGELVAIDEVEFYSGTLRAGNGFSESGGAPADTVAWIGDPVSNPLAVCGDWGTTGDIGGQVLVTGTSWLTANSTVACTTPRSVQCISL